MGASELARMADVDAGDALDRVDPSLDPVESTISPVVDRVANRDCIAEKEVGPPTAAAVIIFSAMIGAASWGVAIYALLT